MDLGLAGRAAIVTGASRGIGKAIAQALGAEGVRLLLVARGEAALETTAGELREAGIEVATLAADLTDPATATTVVARCQAELGGVDVLVNNAGHVTAKPLTELTADDWQRSFEINVFAAARLAVACAPVMRAAGWGRMVHVGSISGRRPGSLFAPYGAAKAALANVSVSLSSELARDGVTSNCIVAGITETELVQSQAAATAERLGTTAEDVMARTLAKTDPPAGRWGRPDEIAAAVAFLCSKQAAWITGATLAVDGGTLRSV